MPFLLSQLCHLSCMPLPNKHQCRLSMQKCLLLCHFRLRLLYSFLLVSANISFNIWGDINGGTNIAVLYVIIGKKPFSKRFSSISRVKTSVRVPSLASPHCVYNVYLWHILCIAQFGQPHPQEFLPCFLSFFIIVSSFSSSARLSGIIISFIFYKC